MSKLPKIFSMVLLLFMIIAPCTADIKSFKIRSDDRYLIDIDKFTFTQTGHVTVSISHVSVTAVQVTSKLSRPDLSRMGFFLVSEDAFAYQYHTSCALDSEFISLLFTFQNLSHSSFTKSYDVTYHDSYTLKFANCNPLSRVTMDVHTEFYNTDSNSNSTTKDYLSAELTNLPSLYSNFSKIYLCFLGFWIFICFINRKSLHGVHFLMGVLLLMTLFHLLCEYQVQHSIKVTGIRPDGWTDMIYALQFITNVLFYTVIAIIIDVCCFSKTDFCCPAKIGLVIVIPLQFFVAIASKHVSLGDSFLWDFGVFFPGMFCNFLDIVIIGAWFSNNSESNSESTLKDAKTDLSKTTLFSLFYIVFIVYSCVDFVCGIGGIDWTNAEERNRLVVYMVMFLVFKPSEKNDLFVPLNLQEPTASVELGDCGV